MTDYEQKWDERLHIHSVGRDSSNADEYRFPYEPTPYCVLERLADSGILRQSDVILDYGCGKGRVDFFLSSQLNIKTIGIEYDEGIFEQALENKKSSKSATEFVLTKAEDYEVPPDVTGCYFFNPFSVEILRSVVAKIIASYYAAPREMLLFFYYPSDEYISYLMSVDELEFYDEISCQDLFEGNDPRERVVIFELPGYEIENEVL